MRENSAGTAYANSLSNQKGGMRLLKQKPGGFTLIELLVVVGIIGILAALLLPALTRGKMKVLQTQCGSNLRQMGISFRMFADEHYSRFPMQLTVQKGGAYEYTIRGEGWKNFQVMSNTLVNPKLLVCPADKSRSATNWNTLNNTNTSFFVAIDARLGKANHMLAGDRNIVTADYPTPGVVPLKTNTVASWTEEMHYYRGNILFADNHLESLDSEGLQRVIARHGLK